ncbi:MAG: DUF4954 family protein, partial [Alistipes sp.]
MSKFRNLTDREIAAVEALGTSAEDWSRVTVAQDFAPSQLLLSRLEGSVEIASGACIHHSRVQNYRIGERSFVEQITALECRHESTFGNGVPVATMNECAGRTVHICEQLSAQAAYIMAIYRHRPQTIAALERMAATVADQRRSMMGTV